MRATIDDALRGLTGGLLFGTPLLYTMEVWWIGQRVEPERAVVTFAAAIVPVIILVATGGFRRVRQVYPGAVVFDTVIALGLGVIASAAVLVLLQRVTLTTPPGTAATMILFQAAPFAIGAAVARQIVARAESGDGAETATEAAAEGDSAQATLADLGATALGALFIALTIAPTDEVPMLSSSLSLPALTVVVGASLLVSYGIVFVAGFGKQEARLAQAGVLQRPLTETVVAYLVSLAVAGAALWYFDNVVWQAPWTDFATRVGVLGLPAAIGGAAGRLAI